MWCKLALVTNRKWHILSTLEHWNFRGPRQNVYSQGVLAVQVLLNIFRSWHHSGYSTSCTTSSCRSSTSWRTFWPKSWFSKSSIYLDMLLFCTCHQFSDFCWIRLHYFITNKLDTGLVITPTLPLVSESLFPAFCVSITNGKIRPEAFSVW